MDRNMFEFFGIDVIAVIDVIDTCIFFLRMCFMRDVFR